jgi:5-methylcytosine-specific restriction protein A
LPVLNAARVAQRFSALLNVSISAEPKGNTERLEVRVAGLERPHGFVVECWAGLSFVYSKLKLDSLSGSILNALSSADSGAWTQLFDSLESLAAIGNRIDVTVNGLPATIAPTGTVTGFEMSSRSVNWQGEIDVAAADLGASLTAVFLAMLPLDNPDLDESHDAEGWQIEGQLQRISHNRYERSRSNRALAILAHGTRCIVCGFDFERHYGPFGAGYVEIHHLLPVHLMDSPRVINPLEELVPLCSNCHSMVHRVDPPIPPDALRAMVEANRE